MSQDYRQFLESKTAVAMERGALFAHSELNPALLPHQGDLSIWAARGGNRAVFANFGLGKTLIQIQLCLLILSRIAHQGRSLVICPLGVKGEFHRDALRFFGIEMQYARTNEELAELSAAGCQYFVTNYERVRDGNLDPNQFDVVTLDEASVLRSYGSKTYQTFLTLFAHVPYKFVATATPSPNRFKELIHYAGFLGVMDTGQALTRWFKRDSQSAGNLTIHPHKEREFWLWVSTWATFLTKPSDLGYSDEGYDLPPVNMIRHRLDVDHSTAGFDSWGQGKLLRNAATSLSAAAKEKRDSMTARVLKAKQIVDAGTPDDHWIIWHDLEDERRLIEKVFSVESEAGEFRSVWGSQQLEPREQSIADFTDGLYRILATKTSIAGSGCNFQRHCHKMIFTGLNYKANDFMQATHRLVRYLQTKEVEVHLIYTESEDAIHDELMRKCKQHEELAANMARIIKENGLNNARAGQEMQRSIGIHRQQEQGQLWQAVNNDNVEEMRDQSPDSVDMVLTSWPFSNHYEYTASYNDFGHNTDDARFFEQMDFLTPHMVRALKPGRMYCVHAKDRLLYGSVTNLGMYSVNPFSDKCVAHLQKHGLIYCGRITVVTDVVRENSQTYRLGWSENAKDGTKMGVGSPEYILLFRKLPSDLTNAYADEPVAKPKEQYTRSRWQFDASPFWRSNGDRFLTPEQIREMPLTALREAWHEFDRHHVYNFKQHVQIAESLESAGLLPASFMLLDPTSHSEWVWDDVVRMRTLNTEQARKRVEGHICPLQFDVVDRLIERYSNPGDLILDPFGGLMTVPYRAVLLHRRGLGIELNSEYWADGVGYCRHAEMKITAPTLFDLTGDEHHAIETTCETGEEAVCDKSE